MGVVARDSEAEKSFVRYAATGCLDYSGRDSDGSREDEAWRLSWPSRGLVLLGLDTGKWRLFLQRSSGGLWPLL